MTEKAFWNRVLRKALHKPPHRLAYKVQDAFVKGLPDVVAQINGLTFWIELKTLKHAPVRESTPWKVGVTMEQRRWLTAWNRAYAGAPLKYHPPGHVPAFVLLWVDREKKWYALDPSIPDEVSQADFSQYVLAEGLKETLLERLFNHG